MFYQLNSVGVKVGVETIAMILNATKWKYALASSGEFLEHGTPNIKLHSMHAKKKKKKKGKRKKNGLVKVQL